MSRSNLRDLVGGGFAAALGTLLLVWLIPNYVEESTQLRLSVGLMPRLTAILMIVFGLLQVVAALHPSSSDEPEETFPSQNEVKTIFGLLLVVGISVLAMTVLPYLAVAPLLVGALAFFYRRGNWARIVLVALLGAGGVYVIIRYIFERPLP